MRDVVVTIAGLRIVFLQDPQGVSFQFGAASFLGTATFSAVRQMVTSRSPVNFVGVGWVDGVRQVILHRESSVLGTGLLTAMTNIVYARAATVVGLGLLVATAIVQRVSSSAIFGEGSLTATPEIVRGQVAEFLGVGLLTALGERVVPRTSSIVGMGLFSADADLLANRTSTMSGVGLLFAEGFPVSPTEVVFEGSGELQVDEFDWYDDILIPLIPEGDIVAHWSYDEEDQNPLLLDDTPNGYDGIWQSDSVVALDVSPIQLTMGLDDVTPSVETDSDVGVTALSLNTSLVNPRLHSRPAVNGMALSLGTPVVPTVMHYRPTVNPVTLVTSISAAETFDPLVLPNDLSNLISWYDAADVNQVIHEATGQPVIPSAGPQKVITFKDKASGLDLGQTLSPSTRPTWDETWSNGKGVISFFGEHYLFRGGSAPYSNNLTFTVLAVVDFGGAGAGLFYQSKYNNFAAPSWRLGVNASQAGLVMANGSGGENGATAVGSGGEEWVIYRIAFFPPTATITVRTAAGVGTPVNVNSVFVESNQGLYMGVGVNAVGAPFYFTGGVGELCAWNRALTAGEESDMINYVETKWGL